MSASAQTSLRRFGQIRARHLFSFSHGIAESLWDKEDLRRSIVEWWSALGRSEAAPLPDDLTRALRPLLQRLPGGGRYLAQEVRRCFGVEVIEDLVRRESPGDRAIITLQIPDGRGRQNARCRADFGSKGVRVAVQFDSLPQVSGFNFGDSESLGFDPADPSFLLVSVVSDVFESLMSPLTRRAYYLPAGRTGVMHSHQVVVSTLIQSATAAGMRPSASSPLLSGVLADFLDGLIGMSRSARKSSRELADVLEQNLLAGAVRLDRSESGYPSFVYRPANWDSDLPLTRTSSMVSELAPVVLYLRHLVEPGNVLIIEEPESHLHPALQAEFTRELARLVHSGVRVMLTTHSEWILESLANLVRLSELSEERREGIPGAGRGARCGASGCVAVQTRRRWRRLCGGGDSARRRRGQLPRRLRRSHRGAVQRVGQDWQPDRSGDGRPERLTIGAGADRRARRTCAVWPRR